MFFLAAGGDFALGRLDAFWALWFGVSSSVKSMTGPFGSARWGLPLFLGAKRRGFGALCALPVCSLSSSSRERSMMSVVRPGAMTNCASRLLTHESYTASSVVEDCHEVAWWGLLRSEGRVCFTVTPAKRLTLQQVGSSPYEGELLSYQSVGLVRRGYYVCGCMSG